MQNIHKRALLGLPPMEEGVAAGLARGVGRTTVNPPGSTGADKAFRGDQPHVALQLVLAGLGRQCDLRQSGRVAAWLAAVPVAGECPACLEGPLGLRASQHLPQFLW